MSLRMATALILICISPYTLAEALFSVNVERIKETAREAISEQTPEIGFIEE